MSGAGDLVGRGELPATAAAEATLSAPSTHLVETFRNENLGPWFQWRSARGFVWNRVRLEIAGLSPLLVGLRILHLSDFHATTYWDPAYDDLIAGIRQAPPDLILFTGDFVDSKRDFRPAVPIVRRLVEGLCSRLGMLAILGNHDSDLLAAPMQGWGVTILDGRHMRLGSGGRPANVVVESAVSPDFRLPGFSSSPCTQGEDRGGGFSAVGNRRPVTDVVADRPSPQPSPWVQGEGENSYAASNSIRREIPARPEMDPQIERAAIDVIGLPGVDRADLDARFLRSIPPHEPGSVRIVLSHFPDAIRRVEGLAADIFLAGHTHGGQICFPGGHPLASHDSLPNRFARGIHRFGNSWLVVNRGFGFSSKLQMRMFCAAEAIEIELAAAPQEQGGCTRPSLFHSRTDR